jgi:hypothetical protein
LYWFKNNNKQLFEDEDKDKETSSNRELSLIEKNFPHSPLFLIGVYTIGKEYFLSKIAKTLKRKLYINESKEFIFNILKMNSGESSNCSSNNSFVNYDYSDMFLFIYYNFFY